MGGARWKVCVIVTQETASYTARSVESLLGAGFEGLHLFGPRGVAISDGLSVVRQRCAAGSSEASLFAEAMAMDHRALVQDVDFVLFIRADVELWKSARLLMESTIESNFISIYFPYAPPPFFEAAEHHLPCNGFGWCEVQAEEPMSGAPCFAMNKHTAALLAAPVRDLARRSAVNAEYDYWKYLLSVLLRDFDVPAFVHTPSLAKRFGSVEDTVAMSASLKDGFQQRNWYLN